MFRLAISIILSITLFSATAFSQDSINYKKLKKYQWYEVNSQNFRVISNEKPEKLNALAIELEQFRYFVSTYMGLTQLDGLPPVKFLVLKNGSSFSALNLSPDIAGIYSAQTGGFFSIASGDSLKLGKKKPTWGRHVIYHEILHHFEGNQAEKLFNPLWYREGIAEYLATMVKRKDNIIFGDVSVLSSRFGSMVSDSGSRYRSVDLENLFKAKQYVPSDITSKRKRRLEANRFYARSFITVHYFNSSPEKRKQLKLYLRLLNQGKTIEEAFKLAFDSTFEALTADVDDYLKGRKLLARAFSTKGKGFTFPEFQPVVKALNIDDALFKAINIRLRFTGHSKSKDYQVSRVLEDFKKHVNNLDYLALLHARFDDNESPESTMQSMQKLIDKKVHLSQAHYHYGNALWEKAEFLRKTGGDNWLNINKKSRSHFRKSISVYNFNGDALSKLAKSYIYSPYNDKNAKEGAVCYEILSVLHEVPEDIRIHAILRAALGEYGEALRLINRYIGLKDDSWSKGYATWLRDSLLFTQLPQQTVKSTTQNSIIFDNGGQYSGDILNGMAHGKGEYVARNGARYKGQWQKNLPHGVGFIQASNDMTYQGDFLEGAVHGQGTLVYSANKDKPHHYNGGFYRFMEHGNGAMQYNYYLHEGPWVKGSEHGPSVVTLRESGEKKQIDWVWGVPVIKQSNGSVIISSDIKSSDFTLLDRAIGYCKAKDDKEFTSCRLRAD